MDDREIEELSKEHPPEEMSEEEKTAVRMREFLEETQKKFDIYFGHLGYVCFIFNKGKHKGESVFVSNSPEDVGPIVEPFANAANVGAAKVRKNNLKQLRRMK